MENNKIKGSEAKEENELIEVKTDSIKDNSQSEPTKPKRHWVERMFVDVSLPTLFIQYHPE